MLSLSAEKSQSDIDLQMVNGEESALAGDIEHGIALMKFAEACMGKDEETLNSARDVLLAQAGPAVLVDAAGVVGNFQRMVRIADSTGIPLDERSVEAYSTVVDALDLGRFASAGNTTSRELS